MRFQMDVLFLYYVHLQHYHRAEYYLLTDNYFHLLEKPITEYDLVGKPGQLFNIDENGFLLRPKAPKGIFEVWTQNAAAVTKHKSLY